jgi:hypothetical protein
MAAHGDGVRHAAGDDTQGIRGSDIDHDREQEGTLNDGIFGIRGDDAIGSSGNHGDKQGIRGSDINHDRKQEGTLNDGIFGIRGDDAIGSSGNQGDKQGDENNQPGANGSDQDDNDDDDDDEGSKENTSDSSAEESDGEDYMHFYVNCFNVANLTGKIVDVMAKPHSTVMSVKCFLWGKLGIKPTHQRLLFKGNDLMDFDLLGDVGIDNDVVLEMMFRGHGGGSSKAVKKTAGKKKVYDGNKNTKKVILDQKLVTLKQQVENMGAIDQGAIAADVMLAVNQIEAGMDSPEAFIETLLYQMNAEQLSSIGGMMQKNQERNLGSIGSLLMQNVIGGIDNIIDQNNYLKEILLTKLNVLFVHAFVTDEGTWEWSRLKRMVAAAHIVKTHVEKENEKKALVPAIEDLAA